ncbi:MAG: hypothetical protein OXF83_09155 [Anaerolineaceae bacterium]|nr:hypothetical protein [Anaerolineaceae bacterium]
MYTVVTLYQLRAQLGLRPKETADDHRLLWALGAATRHCERYTGRKLLPVHATHYHDVDRRHPKELLLEDDLLELTGVTNGDGRSIPLSQLRRIPNARQPASALRLNNGTQFVYRETPLAAVAVDGIWGWHDDWSRAWRDTGVQVQEDPLTAAAVTLTVPAEEEKVGRAPRFQVGQLLRIGDEYLRLRQITAVRDGGLLLTLTRGAQESPASTHRAGSAIHRYHPPDDLTQAVLQLAAWLVQVQRQLASQDLPPAIRTLLRGLRRTVVRV